jgi:hypothetical protein
MWSRPRLREHNGLATLWNFDGLSVGLIGYRSPVNGKPLLLGAAALCEWNRRRSVG